MQLYNINKINSWHIFNFASYVRLCACVSKFACVCEYMSVHTRMLVYASESVYSCGSNLCVIMLPFKKTIVEFQKLKVLYDICEE